MIIDEIIQSLQADVTNGTTNYCMISSNKLEAMKALSSKDAQSYKELEEKVNKNEKSEIEQVLFNSLKNKSLPYSIKYKNKTYNSYNSMDMSLSSEKSEIYYINDKNLQHIDDTADYFIVKTTLYKINNGYKGIKSIDDIYDRTTDFDYNILNDWIDNEEHYYDIEILNDFSKYHVCIPLEEGRESSLDSYLARNIEALKNLPKTSDLNKLTYDIYLNVCESDSNMYFIDTKEDLEDEEYTLNDLKLLEEDIKKYHLEDVITINDNDILITGYGDLQCMFNDDLSFLEELNDYNEIQ